MAVVGKEKSKYLFIDDEGEITDSDDEGKTDKELKAQRDAEFISEWSAKAKERKDKEEMENATMELVSDEEQEAVIDTQPLAFSVVIRDDFFGRDFLKGMSCAFARRFGEESLILEANGISVTLTNFNKNKDTNGNRSKSSETAGKVLETNICDDDNTKCNTEGKSRDVDISGDNFISLSLSSENKIDASNNLSPNPTNISSSALKCEKPELSVDETECSLLNKTSSGQESVAVLFYDKDFCDVHFDAIKEMCESIFGTSKVTASYGIIEVVKNDLVDFDLDTSGFGKIENIRYSVPDEGLYVDPNAPKRPKMSCFNCGGSHNLYECKARKNYEVINANKEKMRQMRMNSKMRYHAAREKFSGLLAPGHVSPALRDALGLRSNELPRHIYQMRKHGYPPGWLQEARIAHSGVSVYGKAGVVPEDGDEDGQVFEDGEKDSYDMKKLIKYPGFNAPAEPDVEEEHEKYECPAFSEEQAIGHMIERLAPSAYQAYKRRKIKDDDSEEEDNDDSAQSDQKKPTSSTPAEATPPAKPLIVTAGTPILPSASPYASLPARDKFSHNISDVINFENLPNATGTYDKVSSSIAKVRQYLRDNAQ